MARVATPELAAAVSAAGGLGALGSAMLDVDELRAQVAAVRAVTDRPFQLNFFCHAPPHVDACRGSAARAALAPLYEELGLGEPPEPSTPPIAFDEQRLEALLEIRPPVVSFHFGLPGVDALAACREAGITVLASATTVAEARDLEERGVDAVVAQGAEAGGHRGSYLVDGDDGPVGTLALVPQVVDAVSVPVVAAGGIADGRGLAAALVLGAGAAQVGTAFLVCPESAAPPLYREALARRRRRAHHDHARILGSARARAAQPRHRGGPGAVALPGAAVAHRGAAGRGRRSRGLPPAVRRAGRAARSRRPGRRGGREPRARRGASAHRATELFRPARYGAPHAPPTASRDPGPRLHRPGAARRS